MTKWSNVSVCKTDIPVFESQWELNKLCKEWEKSHSFLFYKLFTIKY